MATLQKIRNRAGILVAVVIGLALLAFIMGDLFSSGPSVFSGNRMEVAEIDGESINYMEYNAKIEELSNFYRMNYQMNSLDQETLENIRQEVWRTTVRDIILGSSFEDLGVRVSVEELKIMLLGDSINAGGQNVVMEEPHPIVKQMFTNPETGQFNRVQMMNYFTAISDEVYAEERRRWVYIENQIVDQRKSEKYFTLVEKGLQPNSLDAKKHALENGSTVDFSFVFVNFNTVPDEEVNVTQAELKNYYNEHINEFQQDEGRSIEFVVFPIEPSTEDDNLANDFIRNSKIPFQRTDNPINFVNSNSDVPYEDINYDYEDLPENYRDSIFNAEPGYVAGPYYEDQTYKLARLLEFNYLPDSVRARHILISLSVQRDDIRARNIADSLKSLVQEGEDFVQLAREFSADESNREIGGDLGWFTEGTMVKPFSDAVFDGEPGEVKVVKTNFGYHVIRIEEHSPEEKKAKLAILQRQVLPSDQTYQEIYSSAVQFRSEATTLEQFRQQYQEQNLTPRFASDFQKNVRELPGLENAREIVRWAYENEENSISQIFDLGDRYIVAALTDVKEEGYAKLEDVETEIELALIKEKKIDQLAENVRGEVDGATGIDEAASTLNSEIQEAQSVRFSNPYVTGVGIEPAVVATAFETETGDLEGPVKGENGVFVLQVNNKTIPEQPDIASAEFQMKYSIQSRVSYGAYQALQEKANIEDNRIRFY